MTAVLRWTGREARLLREALRMSVREFAGHLGYNDSAVSNWERRGDQVRLRTQTQRDLDVALRLAPGEARERFDLASRPANDPDDRNVSPANLLPPPFPDTSTPLVVSSALEFDEILCYLRDQWHALVKTDNLLGPRHALAGVHGQLAVLKELLRVCQGDVRTRVVRLAAQYAESAAWLHEDARDLALAHAWTSQATEWAHEADDTAMLAWTAFRRSQQSAEAGNAAQVVALAQAARRDEDRLPAPMRAATRVQEAQGRAMDGDERTTQRLLDDALRWAADDSDGDARGGHGSFCTASYIEIHRAGCLVLLGQPRRAITCYDQALPGLPTVYRRDRAAALAGKASAHAAAGEPDVAAATALAALPSARRAGSRRIVAQLAVVGQRLTPHRRIPAVIALLDDLGGAA